MADHEEKQLGDLTVRIDRNTCIGSSNCVNVAPEVFALDDRQIVTFTVDPREIERPRLIDACRECPVDALEIINGDGKRLVPS